VLRWTTTPSGA